MRYIIVFCLFCIVVAHRMKVQASTHWMVTESGLIQPRHDSPFDMARPYDLLGFLNQEKRWESIFELYEDLMSRQLLVNKLWVDIQKDTDIEPLLSQDENCIKAGNLNLIDWYATFLDNGRSRNIPEEEFRLPKSYQEFNADVPDCKKISSLTFSMFTFEHLEGMIYRDNLTDMPKIAMPLLIPTNMTTDQFGYWINSVLRQNTSSWLHYNMAALYWRLEGNAPKAMECCRRAVHYSPREHKDLTLLNMGTIFHRSKLIEDAIIVLNAAVDHNSESYQNHHALANAYATYGDFNSSIKHFEECYRINSILTSGEKYRNAALCYAQLAPRVEDIRRKLNKLQDELNEYNKKKITWTNIQGEFLRTIRHVEEFDFRNTDKIYERMSEITGLNTKELRSHGDKNYLIKYFLDDPIYSNTWQRNLGVEAVDAVYSLQKLIKRIEKSSNMSPESMNLFQSNNEEHEKDKHKRPIDKTSKDVFESRPGDNPFNIVDEEIQEYAIGVIMYPPTMNVNRNIEDFDVELDWPSDKFCLDSAPKFPPNVEAIFPTFLPFENKGIRLKTLLTDKIGVSMWDEHELPWHPPNCPHDKEAATFTQKKTQKSQLLGEVVDSGYLRQKLLEYVSDGNLEMVKHMQDAEIGQRIYSAMKKRAAPKWMLLVLSSLYWRVRRNNLNALHCLLTANRLVQPRYKDIVLVSMASVYLEMDYFDEALVAAEGAFKINLYEPATNFVLAEINMLKKHRSIHMFHLKQVVRIQAGFMAGLARNLLNAWACILNHVDALRETDFGEEGICTQVEPGVNMVCEKNGENCYITNIKCREKKVDMSTLVRLLNVKNDPQKVDNVDKDFFAWVTTNAPTEREDRLAHYAHFDSMMKTVETALQGCGPLGCQNLKAEDLSLKEEDCKYHRLQFGYWLQYILSFRQMILESDMRIVSEITSIQPSNKKIPECRQIGNPLEDFYLEKLSNVDVEGWEPILSFMHQFTEMFNFMDYALLGAKIAKYVETRARSWAGALCAGWWCGVAGEGACARRCLAAALALAPHARAPAVARTLAALLHLQSKVEDAKEVAYLSFYISPKSKVEAFLVAISHTCLEEYEQAIWMYRYALSLDDQFVPAKACLHATMCLMFYGEDSEDIYKESHKH